MLAAEPIGKAERPRPCCTVNGIKTKSAGFYGFANVARDRCRGFIYGAYLFGLLVLGEDDNEASVVITNTSSMRNAAHPCFLFGKLQLAAAN